jgi:hypothetical protein
MAIVLVDESDRDLILAAKIFDMRSYSEPNTFNRQTQRSEETAFLGERQLAWLRQKLRTSRATWKVARRCSGNGCKHGHRAKVFGIEAISSARLIRNTWNVFDN